MAVIDLDDTLLGPDKQISGANRAAVERLQASGMRVLLASGRRHENMLRYHAELGLEGYLVSSQGAMVQHDHNGRLLQCLYLHSEQVQCVTAEGVARALTTIYYNAAGTFTSAHDEWTAVYERAAGQKVKLCQDPAQMQEGTLKILFIGPAAEVAVHLPQLARQLGEGMEVLTSSPHLIEFMARGVSKAAGVAAVLPEYGWGAQQVLAFGDQDNDVALLGWAGLGVAMAHGSAAARQAAAMTAPPGDPATSLARAVELLFAEDFSRA